MKKPNCRVSVARQQNGWSITNKNMQITDIATSKNARAAIALLTIGFLTMSIWNIYQMHQYRKLEYELKKANA